ncbi:Aste57867_24795 [Aphanomyces stellatus]|uniref:Aste57867_24795 protein n=1 Tax=Aphanomyces stellatus TaxID=120398 RepID=A0A485LRG3_9STRA|nr:hypothetical protein As57867_024717 [Aphanomyces stellatus]VFU01430.1 Aste57867_24795 [Aphanomyces stellatus]
MTKRPPSVAPVPCKARVKNSIIPVPPPLDLLAQALFAGFVDSFVVVRTLSLVSRRLSSLSANRVRALDLHATVHSHTLLTTCVLPRYHGGLVSLSLQWTPATTDATVALLAQALPRLTHLNLHGCKAVTNRAVSSISAALPALTSLNLSFCAGIDDVRPLAALSHLRVVKLAMCQRLPSFTLSTLPPSVTELDVGCSPVACDDALLRRFRHLEVLDLSGCFVEAAHVVACTRGTTTSLSSLSLAHCHTLSLADLWRMWHPMPTLKVLVLRGLLEDDGGDVDAARRRWAARVRACVPSLTYLDISCSDRHVDSKRMLQELMPHLVVDDGHAAFPIHPCACGDEDEDVGGGRTAEQRVLVVRPHVMA